MQQVYCQQDWVFKFEITNLFKKPADEDFDNQHQDLPLQIDDTNCGARRLQSGYGVDTVNICTGNR